MILQRYIEQCLPYTKNSVLLHVAYAYTSNTKAKILSKGVARQV